MVPSSRMWASNYGLEKHLSSRTMKNAKLQKIWAKVEVTHRERPWWELFLWIGETYYSTSDITIILYGILHYMYNLKNTIRRSLTRSIQKGHLNTIGNPASTYEPEEAVWRVTVKSRLESQKIQLTAAWWQLRWRGCGALKSCCWARLDNIYSHAQF